MPKGRIAKNRDSATVTKPVNRVTAKIFFLEEAGTKRTLSSKGTHSDSLQALYREKKAY